jgi:MFS superfamily sulfate permease-like transporter
MSCIAGVLLFVAVNMVKVKEVRQVLGMGRFHVALMTYTAVAVILTDFLTGVLTAIMLYALLCRFFERPGAGAEVSARENSEVVQAVPGEIVGVGHPSSPDTTAPPLPAPRGGR